MLFIRNEDKPGFIGHLGTTLGEAGVNVATFHLGRTAPGENAIALVSVDQRISDEVLHKIGAAAQRGQGEGFELLRAQLDEACWATAQLRSGSRRLGRGPTRAFTTSSPTGAGGTAM